MTGTPARIGSLAGTTSAVTAQNFDPELMQVLSEIDPNRIESIITTLAGFGTRHTASSQTDKKRGIGAAIAYVTDLMNKIATTSSGRMTVQQQTFVQPASATPANPTSITNVIATLQGTASRERFLNTTMLTWTANTEPNLAGYEVVMHETTSPDWTDANNVGNVTTVTLDISKDNVQFGVRAVDQNGNRSPVAFPQIAA